MTLPVLCAGASVELSMSALFVNVRALPELAARQSRGCSWELASDVSDEDLCLDVLWRADVFGTSFQVFDRLFRPHRRKYVRNGLRATMNHATLTLLIPPKRRRGGIDVT
jgi:hypothetical protein